MRRNLLAVIMTGACLTALLTACGGDDSSSSVENSAETSVTEASLTGKKLTAIPDDVKVTRNAADIMEKSKSSSKISSKVFKIDGYASSVSLDEGWKLISGGEATDMQTDMITSFPAVVQFKDTKDTLTITVVDVSEDRDSFLAGTEESYKAAYGAAYDSIDITGFRQLSIGKGEYDSFEVKADVVIKGQSCKMIHILSNDVSGKSYSWMLLDSDGQFEDFDLVNAISYPLKVESKLSGRERRNN